MTEQVNTAGFKSVNYSQCFSRTAPRAKSLASVTTLNSISALANRRTGAFSKAVFSSSKAFWRKSLQENLACLPVISSKDLDKDE